MEDGIENYSDSDGIEIVDGHLVGLAP